MVLQNFLVLWFLVLWWLYTQIAGVMVVFDVVVLQNFLVLWILVRWLYKQIASAMMISGVVVLQAFYCVVVFGIGMNLYENVKLILLWNPKDFGFFGVVVFGKIFCGL